MDGLDQLRNSILEVIKSRLSEEECKDCMKHVDELVKRAREAQQQGLLHLKQLDDCKAKLKEVLEKRSN